MRQHSSTMLPFIKEEKDENDTKEICADVY